MKQREMPWGGEGRWERKGPLESDRVWKEGVPEQLQLPIGEIVNIPGRFEYKEVNWKMPGMNYFPPLSEKMVHQLFGGSYENVRKKVIGYLGEIDRLDEDGIRKRILKGYPELGLKHDPYGHSFNICLGPKSLEDYRECVKRVIIEKYEESIRMNEEEIRRLYDEFRGEYKKYLDTGNELENHERLYLDQEEIREILREKDIKDWGRWISRLWLGQRIGEISTWYVNRVRDWGIFKKLSVANLKEAISNMRGREFNIDKLEGEAAGIKYDYDKFISENKVEDKKGFLNLVVTFIYNSRGGDKLLGTLRAGIDEDKAERYQGEADYEEVMRHIEKIWPGIRELEKIVKMGFLPGESFEGFRNKVMKLIWGSNTDYRGVILRELGLGELNPYEDISGQGLIREMSGGDEILGKYLFSEFRKKKDYRYFVRLLDSDELEIMRQVGEFLGRVGEYTEDNLRNVYNIIEESSFRKDYTKYIGSALKGKGTIGRDISNMNQLLDIIHNYGANIPEDEIRGILLTDSMKNLGKSDYIKKLYALMVKILGAGGIEGFRKKNWITIRALERRGLVRKGLLDNLEQIVHWAGREVKLKDAAEVTKLLREVDLVQIYREVSKYFDSAEKVKKDENLFRLDMKMEGGLEFRVLRDLDVRHFSVGIETQCCQAVGGAGEEAMVDSFINPMAGVLILEGGGELIAQSYFHFTGEGYILDNVEVNDKFEEGWKGIPLEEIYAYWARKKKAEMPEIKYILAGKGYSDISASSFSSVAMEKDPRKFRVRYPHTDWSRRGSIDLLAPNFEIKNIGIGKMAELALLFMRMV